MSEPTIGQMEKELERLREETELQLANQPIDYYLTDKAYRALKEEPVDEAAKDAAWTELRASGRKVS